MDEASRGKRKVPETSGRGEDSRDCKKDGGGGGQATDLAVDEANGRGVGMRRRLAGRQWRKWGQWRRQR